MKEQIKQEIQYCRDNNIRKLSDASESYLKELKDVKKLSYSDISWIWNISRHVVKRRFEELGIGDSNMRHFIDNEEVFTFDNVRSKIQKGKLQESQICEILSFQEDKVIVRDKLNHEKHILKLEQLELV